MKKLFLILCCSLYMISCQGQDKKKEWKEAPINGKSMAQQTIPKGSWKVNKELDENGNVIRYDSIYSWSSSQNLDNLKPEQLDSIMGSFQSRFGALFGDEMLKGFFEPDSLLLGQHFGFEGLGEGMPKEMQEMITRMQQMQEGMFQERKPIIPRADDL